MSKPLNEIKAALQTYRNALGANVHTHEDLKLMSLSFEIEQMALKLNEAFLEMPPAEQKVKGVQRVFDVPTPDAELYERFSPASAMYDILMLILKSGIPEDISYLPIRRISLRQ